MLKKLLLAIDDRRPTNRSGFTLIELLIVITITVITIGATGVYLADLQIERSLNNEIRQLTGMLKTAQEKATSQQGGTRWGVYINNPSSGQGTYSLYAVDEALLAGSGIPGIVSEVKKLSNGLVFTKPTTGAALNIMFSRGTGLPEGATSSTIAIDHTPSSSSTVDIHANGNIEF